MEKNEPSILRLIVDAPRGGAENMAIDEAILQAVDAGRSPVTLRFYRWSEPTISLGYFQEYAELSTQPPAIRSLPVVRRQTGGGAILHDDEITYSLVVPLKAPKTDIADLYRLVHDGFIRALQKRHVPIYYRGGTVDGHSRRGPFFCFARRHRLDLLIGPDKILGSAQRRRQRAALQHGSLILGRHFCEQPSGQLNEYLSEPAALDDLLDEVAGYIGECLDLAVRKSALTDLERQTLDDLIDKYEGRDWTCQR